MCVCVCVCINGVGVIVKNFIPYIYKIIFNNRAEEDMWT